MDNEYYSLDAIIAENQASDVERRIGQKLIKNVLENRMHL